MTLWAILASAVDANKSTSKVPLSALHCDKALFCCYHAANIFIGIIDSALQRQNLLPIAARFLRLLSAKYLHCLQMRIQD